MLAIKLAQTGKTNKKMFRLVISEKNRDPYGRVLEILGSYNPHTKELAAKEDRIKHWLAQGAQMTATVNNLLVGKSLISGDKVKASKKGKVNEKRAAQLKAKSDKKNQNTTVAAEPAVTPDLASAEPEKKAEEAAPTSNDTATKE